MRFVFKQIAIALCLAAGIIASQIPEFAQQYRQRLGGALDELQAALARFDHEAAQEGLDRRAAIARLEANADPLASKRGSAMALAWVRADRLARQRQEFVTAGSVHRLLILASDYDPVLASGVWRDFEPAVPATLEGAISAAIGFFGMGICLSIVAAPFQRRQALQGARDFP